MEGVKKKYTKDRMILAVGLSALILVCVSGCVNQQAHGLLARSQNRAGKIHCFSADFKLEMAGDDIVGPVAGHIVWKSPNLYRLEMWPLNPSGAQDMDEAKPHKININDGHTHYFIDSDSSITRSPADLPIDRLDSLLILSIIMPDSDTIDNSQIPPASKLTLSTTKWQGSVYKVVSSWDVYKADETVRSNTRLFIGSDGLVHRMLVIDNGKVSLDTSISNLHIDPPLPRDEFAFAFPPAAKNWAEILADERTPIDPKSKELLRTVMQRLQDLRSISASFTVTRTYLWPHAPGVQDRTAGVIKLLRPSYAYVKTDRLTVRDGHAATDRGSLLQVLDGKFKHEVSHNSQYSGYDRAAENDLTRMEATSRIECLQGFFEPIWSLFDLRDGLSEMHYMGKETWQGATYDVIAGSRPPYKPKAPGESGPAGENNLYYVGSDGIIHRIVRKLDFGDSTMGEEDTLENIALNPDLKPADFKFSPPPGSNKTQQTQTAPSASAPGAPVTEP